jgi:hypothetical protein
MLYSLYSKCSMVYLHLIFTVGPDCVGIGMFGTRTIAFYSGLRRGG